jgi:type II secretory ATPase GspE/PulE/Tfp pilus assembly ATPase PilB-like protein
MILQETGGVVFRNKVIEMGMETLVLSGLGKVKEGTTTLEEVMGVCAGD